MEALVNAVNLWDWEGRIRRSTYAIAGSLTLALKLALDWWVVTRLFHRPWSVLFYWRPFGAIRSLSAISGRDRGFGWLMLTIALPFVWLGLTLTVKRLRDAGHPAWLVCLFFVPGINLVFFALLCVLPAVAGTPAREAPPWLGGRALDPWIPRSPWGSAIVATGLTTVLGLLLTLLSTAVLGTYGLALFVAMPFCLGLFAVLTYSYHGRRTFRQCLYVAVLPVVLLGLVLLVVAIEGLICILMAAPIAAVLTMLGGTLGYALQSGHWGRTRTPAMLGAVVLFLPAFTGAEKMLEREPDEFVVTSAVEVKAPPEKVWKEVISFSEIGPPRELLFRAGIAYPIRAEISGHGPGAIRRCRFTTGDFIEPIEVWDQPRLLRFGVTHNPAPMEEWTPYRHIAPPHLSGYFQSHQGQFELTELPGGRTLLRGTTWYSHAIWPAEYWHWWSDYIIHRIHMRVLEHIQRRVETGAA